MTNKYQDALVKMNSYNMFPIGELKEAYTYLQELVDKSEYKPPEQVTHVYGTIIECPVCHHPITSLGLYCANCGQRIKPYGEQGTIQQ